MAIDEVSKSISRSRDSLSSSAPSSNNASKPSTVGCPFASRQHEGKEMTNASLRLSPQIVFKLIFQDDAFLNKLYANRKYDDRTPTEWETNAETGEKTRKVTYKVTLPSKALGPSSSFVTEFQTLSEANQENELYVANSVVINEGIPYGDYFVIHVHYCIVREASTDPKVPQCRFSYWTIVKFKKSPFFVIKNLIEKNTMDEIEALCRDIVTQMVAEAETLYGAISMETSVRNPLRVDGRSPERRRKTKRPPPPPLRSSWKSSSVWLAWSLLIILGVMNAYLLNQLLSLERKADETYSRITVFERPSLPPTEGNLIRKLREMEDIEESLMKFFERWKGHLEEANRGLQMAEDAIAAMKTSIPEYEGQWSQIINTASDRLEDDNLTKNES